VIKIINLILFFLTCFITFSQKFSFIPFSTSEGLPQSQVSSVVQDDKGYLWIGTLGGLAKFNGGEFITFSSENGLLNNRVSFLTIIDKELWVGHEGGVSCFKDGSFKNWRIPDNNVSNVKSIVRFKGEVFVASHLGLYKISGSRLVKVVDKSSFLNHIRSILVIDEVAYIATMEGLYYGSDMVKLKRIDELDQVNISGLGKDQNRIIITSYFEGVYELNISNLKIKNVNIGNNDYTIKGVYVDSKQNKWYNTNGGIIRQNKSGNIKLIDENNGLSFGLISTIYEDNEGSIWIGTLGKGVLRFPSQNFVYYDVSTGINSDLILTVKSDNTGDFWFGSFDKGIFKKNKQGYKSIYHDIDNHIWSSVFEVDGCKWFGSDYGLISVKQDNVENIFYKENGLASDAVTSLYKVHENSMLVGGTNGFSYYNQGLFSFFQPSNSIGIVRDFEELDGKLYCETSKGLFMKDGDSILKVCKLNVPVSCIELDQKKNLWVGTEEGLFIYKKGVFKRVSFSSLPSSNLINFLNHKNGEVFIGTNNGLYVIKDYEVDKDFVFSYFGIGDGLIDVETNLNSDFFDKKGRLWFGTSSGLVRFDYKNHKKKKISPVLNLKSILLNYSKDELLKFSESKDGKPFNINLPYNKNNLAFEIDGVSLSNHANLSYQFKLIGLDTSWSPSSKNSVISFTGLGAEDYTLYLRAVDENGVFSNQITIPFVINSPFYKTYWFVISFIVFVSGVIYLLFKLKVKRELENSNNKMLAYKSKLMSLEQKSLNASMNRHFIFNSLNSIQYFINSQDRLSANRYLTNFAKLIRKNLDATNESGNMVTLAQELEGLDLYLSLEAMRFKGRFVYEIVTNDIDVESIIIPAMLLQPFVENAIIHGVLPNEDTKGEIKVSITSEKSILTIQIDDNGIGIKNSLRLKELAEGDHKSQGMEITSKRIDLIKKISNKGFEIIGPFQIGGLDSKVTGTRVLLKIPFENLDS